MSYRVVRQSKFRHIFGSNAKREQCYDNIRVSQSSWDSTFCAVNPKFIAVIVESGGGGAFLVLPLEKTGRIAPDVPLVAGHKGPVLDIAWCPHNDNVIASASEDGLVKVWQIPDSGVVRTMTQPVVDLAKHQRRVGLVLWHPSARNVLLSAGSDNLVIIWDVGTGSVLFSFSLPDLVYSGCWNWDGSEVIFTCRDRMIRRVNPRTGSIDEEAIAHEGGKASRAIFLKNGLIFTTGFTKHSERQYSLRAPGHLNDPIVMVELDTSNGVMFPLYDSDANLIYLCGKGDSVIRYFEVTAEPPFVHYINTFQSSEPQRAIGIMPKRGCDVSVCEITRFYRLTNNGFCQTIPFVVPRKSELFQDDLYPDTRADDAAITATEWKDGTDSDPVMVPVLEMNEKLRAENKVSTVGSKSNILDVAKPTSNSVRKTSSVATRTTSSSNGTTLNTTSNGGGGCDDNIANLTDQTDLIRQITHAVLDEVGRQTESLIKTRTDEIVSRLRCEFKTPPSSATPVNGNGVDLATSDVSPNKNNNNNNSRGDGGDVAVEIRKLKAMIVKHEARIRSLEAKLKSSSSTSATSAGTAENATINLNASTVDNDGGGENASSSRLPQTSSSDNGNSNNGSRSSRTNTKTNTNNNAFEAKSTVPRSTPVRPASFANSTTSNLGFSEMGNNTGLSDIDSLIAARRKASLAAADINHSSSSSSSTLSTPNSLAGLRAKYGG